MITTTEELAELRTKIAPDSAIISLYVNIPLDIADHRGLVTRARELIKAASDSGPPGPVGLPGASDIDVAAIVDAVTDSGLDWLGQTVAFFACSEIGLFEAIPLPGNVSDRAIVAARPYLRPLLAAHQRNPAYQVAVLDAEHAWILAVAGTQTDTLAESTGPTVAHGFAGWHGLDAYRMQQRVMQLSHRHYRDTIGTLSRSTEEAQRPLVLGGHEPQINRFVTMLPNPVRQRVAGSFNVDWQTVTPARVRQLSAPVIADWAESTEAQLVNDVLSQPPQTAVTSLRDCVTAVRSRAVSELVLTDDQLVPGCACDDCGAVGIGEAGCDCTDQACRPVPDVLDVLTAQALDGGSQVAAVRQAPFAAAAKLRFALS